jgi:hypothetical protein
MHWGCRKAARKPVSGKKHRQKSTRPVSDPSEVEGRCVGRPGRPCRGTLALPCFLRRTGSFLAALSVLAA